MAAAETRLELSLPATTSSVREVRFAVGRVIRQLTASERVLADVRLCVTEAVTNVIRHAYNGGRGRSVDVAVIYGGDVDDEVTVSVRDTGQGLSARSSKEPGGYGLAIIDRVAKRHTIRSSRDRGTEISMVFALDRPRRALL